MSTRAERASKASAVRLRGLLGPGDVIYTQAVNVTRSKRQQSIRAYVIQAGKPVDVSEEVANLIENSYDCRNRGVRIPLTGTDAFIREVSTMLYPEYKCPGPARCRSEDHEIDPSIRHHSDAEAIGLEWM